jgi:hypothetical protein
MRPRPILPRRIHRPKRPSATALRHFTQNTSRPQLPFLSTPTATRPQQFRYLTTERKAWLKYEVQKGIQYTICSWVVMASVAAIIFAVGQEAFEREYPTPHEWTFRSRMLLRGANETRDSKDPDRITDWVQIIQMLEIVIKRLEDPKIDGQGVKEAPADRPKGTKDISDMPESWRRGYYEALMAYAKAAEQTEGWVTDKTRNIVFPPELVIGPSNPHPRPISHGGKSAPREEDCEVAFESPNDVYLRILSTEGFTPRQRMDAGLAFANWLEFRGLIGPATIVYEDAVLLAAGEKQTGPPALDVKTWTLSEAAGLPSANLLKSLTAYATFLARQSDVSTSLPILISILRARRLLPKVPPSILFPVELENLPEPRADGAFGRLVQIVQTAVKELPYPPPPADGTAPPVRNTKELCEEAALQLHIGEILYTSPPTSRSKSHREEGLAWTREAVDVAEEQLHRLEQATSAVPTSLVRDAKSTCRACLATGLGNWAAMAGKLAREEVEKREQEKTKTKGKASGWLGLWGNSTTEDLSMSRWSSEEKVIHERKRRSKELLEELEPPKRGFMSFLQA